MMLTRSFITSYFILPDESQNIDEIIYGVNEVNKSGFLHVLEPDEEEKARLKNAIINRTSVYKSQREIVEEILDELNINKGQREKFHKLVGIMCKDEVDRDKIHEIIVTNYNMMGWG